MIEQLGQIDTWIALLSLSALEIILGIDNIIFIAILTSRLPPVQQKKAYRVGLAGAMFMRIGLLLAISWVMGLTTPWFTVLNTSVSGRDLILLGGGLFLMAKSAIEIFNKVEGNPHGEAASDTHDANFGHVILQIWILDIVFSLDSVITAVGMVKEVWIMITAVVLAIIVMMLFAKNIGDFINAHPSMKVLALSFLLMIGVLLVAEGTGAHLNKGYVYFAMAYSIGIELLNMRYRKKAPA